jgi:hypothetical protein
MEREKIAVDYSRTRDKRIVELEADIARLHSELRVLDAAESRKALLQRQQEATTALGKDLTGEIEQLRTQLVRARAPHKAPPPNANPSSGYLSKLETVADMARAGLTEEFRIQKKPEPTLQEAILLFDGEDLLPVRWLPLKRALQSLQVIARLEPKRARR